MEEKLKTYMEQLFRDVPDSEQAREIKEEILQNITDKYNDLLAEGKSEEAAYNIAIEGIGDLSELIDSLKQNTPGGVGAAATSAEAGEEETTGSTQEKDSVYREEYMEWKKKSAVRTAVAVMLYILSIVPPIIASELMHDEVVGPCMMFFIIAVATAILVFNSMSKPAYTKKGETVADEFMEWKHNTDVRKQSWRSINSALWSIVLVLYFVISFTTMAWHVTWVIFLLGAAAQSILKVIILNRNDTAGSRTVQIVCGIIAGAVLLFAVVFLGFHFLTKGGFSFPSFNFSIMGGEHYSNSEKYTAGNVTIQPDSDTENALSEIRVDWIDGTVEVSSVDGLREISIEEEGSADMAESDRVHSYYHNGILEIQYRESGWYFFKSSPGNKHLKVKIPAELAKGLKNIDGDFVSSDVTIQNLHTDSLLLDTVSGETKFTGTVLKEIDYDSVSGEGTFNLSAAPKELATDSVSADITVVLPETASFETKLDTVSGRLSCELPTNSQEKEDGNYYISCGDGVNEFDFDSVSGDVGIRAAKSSAS